MKILYSLIFLSAITNAQTYEVLDKNKVKAGINLYNYKFHTSNGTPDYEVPSGSKVHAMIANSLWIGGLDASNQLHIAAHTYTQGETDFFPGPLDTTAAAAYNASNTALYQRLWKIDCKEITDFATAFNSGAIGANAQGIPNAISNYPATGYGTFQKKMSPFFDADKDGVYDPKNDGDYPIIKGHQQVLSIYNDQLANHIQTGGLPMGVEVHERAYAYSEPSIHDSLQAINYTTFYHYTIYNRSQNNYHDVYISDWADIDNGNWTNDFIGSDVTNQFAYCYNDSTLDPTSHGTYGYGLHPPVISHALLPIDCSKDNIDNDQDGLIDESGERFLMNKVTYYNDNFPMTPPATTSPTNAQQYYNYMKGIWKDNSNFTLGGNAYGGTQSTNHVYTGNPQNHTGWTEKSAGNKPWERRLIMSSGPFNLPAKSRIEWGYAIVFSQDTTQSVNTISQFNTRVRRDVRIARWYDAIHGNSCAPSISVGFHEHQSSALRLMVYPNPAQDILTIDLNQNVQYGKIFLKDMCGKIIGTTNFSNSYRAELDLSGVACGIYFIEINTDKGSAIQKISKF